jgi:hypothetical protein
MSSVTTVSSTASLDDYKAVQTAMQSYIDGVIEGRSDRMRPSFHPAASFFGHYNGTLLAGSVQALFDWVDANGPATGTRTQFGQVDIRDTTALVRLEMEGVSGKLSLGGNARLSDFFTLLKIDGHWLITHKTFHWY